MRPNPRRRRSAKRFSSQNDGSGYEVLLRETWGVAEGVVAQGSEHEFSRPDGPICTGRASSEGCWAEIANHPGCYLWNPGPREGFSAIWSGECSEGFAEGMGEVRWQWSDSSAVDSGLLRGGQREGFHVINWSSGDRSEGSYVNGERHGTWTGYDASGNGLGTVRYENGRRVGGLEGRVVLSQFTDNRFRSDTEALQPGARGQLSTQSAGRGSAWRMAPCT